MMYTSQEGELYLGQARALGAVGVLPKQIKPTDVSKVLYQLHLAAGSAQPRAVALKPVTLDALAEATWPRSGRHRAIRPLTETALREQFASCGAR